MRGDDKRKDPLQEALKTFEKTTKTPVQYLKEQKDVAAQNRALLKSLFDYAKSTGTHFKSDSLPDELFINDLDEEQIWQQIEMQNDFFWEKCMSETCRLLSLNEQKLTLKVNYGDENGDEGASSDDESNGEANGVEEGDESDVVGEEEEELDDEDENEDEDDENEDDEGPTETVKAEKLPKDFAPSVVDDKFFNLNEMHAFLDAEDKKELDRLNGKRSGKGNDIDDTNDDIDYFESNSESDSDDEESGTGGGKAKGLMFNEFFDTEDQVETPEQMRQRRREERDAKNKRKEQEMKEDLGMDSDEEESGDENQFEKEQSDEEQEPEDENEQSEFDLRQHRLNKRIEELEEQAISDKPWQLKGEISSSTRPKNSLLEEVLEFDSVVRSAPLITEETTVCLEDLIKRRIKSKAWDDVERKIKPVNDHQDFRKTLILQQEKSKESLAQIYEKEYLEKVHKLNNVDDADNPKEPAEHTEIRKSIRELFVKLDALSNFHFTSKPVAAEAKIITNMPAIEMEEVAPVGVSDATLLAPEEVRARPIGDELGKTERTDTDKKRERRKKKLKQKLHKIHSEKRILEKEKLGIKVTTKEKQQQLMNQVTKSRNVIKGKPTDDNKALKSSKNFFNQMQDNATSAIKSKSLGKQKSKSDASAPNAKRLKL